MKNNIYIVMILAVLGFTACEEYTDIKPKGKNLLETADELEYLLNYSFNSAYAFNLRDLYDLDNDMYSYGYGDIPTILSGTVKDLQYARLTYDAGIDRAALTKTDRVYEGIYSIICTRLNMILEQAPNVNDDPDKVEELKSEALVLRAYLHYILVNIYAKAYNPSTAETDGGIAYMNKTDFESLSVKSTVAEVYQNMLSDINAALESNSLPDQPATAMRVAKGFAYAVKARILLSMRDYENALIAAGSSLSYNNTLEDHRAFIGADNLTRVGLEAEDNLFFITSQDYNPTQSNISIDIINNYYEPGNIIKDFVGSDGFPILDIEYGEYYTGITGAALWYAADYQQNAAGMTTSDTYLIKAECLIRTGEVPAAMDVINYIRERRITPDVYAPVNASNELEAMTYLKKVSRIEFLCTWKNFVNIKRWNTEDAYKETINRNINGIIYTLTPDSPLWIFPFPQSATNYNLNLTQNY
ncbi:MAG: RagB/SusD family nutrient uptake outer membrane protein [Marinifilaceae bacterium]|nr:RagB/SusD family nutrient uptake outer membrane protein [Marinifilaceae bacterium]